MSDQRLPAIFRATGPKRAIPVMSGRDLPPPVSMAAVLADAVVERSAPMLDPGCGKGISGADLRNVGFTVSDGADFCDAMLEKAAGRQIWRALQVTHPAEPLRFTPGSPAAVTATGVPGNGHALTEIPRRMLAILPQSGFIEVTPDDHTPAYRGCNGWTRDTGDQPSSADTQTVVCIFQGN